MQYTDNKNKNIVNNYLKTLINYLYLHKFAKRVTMRNVAKYVDNPIKLIKEMR